uniref:Uncharacterized protein n=3 Tax=Bionectria ochroleuca TaxID=29856 RepID=A0A0B7KGH8_BIOOC
MKVSDYNQQHGDQADTEFVFVSYTRLQFRVFTDAEINAWTNKSEDVYRICDIVRAAHSMIIAIGPPADEKEANILNGDENVSSGTAEHANKWLRQWGSRLWTLPELLLCPNEYRIKLCVAGDVNEPKSLAKRNFAERAWDDAESVKELVNHYEGSAILPPTQLISIALECFARRKTDQFSQGDIAYAVMGLFPDSQRPVVNQNDSGFRAFARLALAVEGSSLLTRLLCLAPAQPGAQWVINCAAPPIAMMLCGEDAAGHRAILCSYNHETGVYHREETLRVEECVRQQMKSARSVNLSLEPFPLKLTKAPHDEDVINSSLDGQAPTKSREWKPELVFFIIQCIATPQYRIIQLSEVTHRNSFVLLFFGFVLAQPIAFFLLHKRLFSRAVAPMVYLQAAFQSLSIAKTMKYETIFIIVFQGIAIGLFLPYMVLHTISWHSIRETAFRLLFLTSSAMMYRDKARQHATGALYISIFALFSTSLLDLPEVKPWTNSFEGVSLTRRSARHKFSAEEREHAPRWARQDLPQSATIISLLFFIMATVSNSVISGALINTYHLFFYDPNVGLKSFYCLLTFFITILLWIYPHFIHTVTLGCSTISILGLYGCSMLGSNTFVWPAMASAQLLILPLSWIWIVHRTTSWKGFITYVTLSLAGWGGWRLANNLIGELGKQQVFIFAALQPCLFGCVWVLEVIRERRVAQAAQRRLVRSEYQDNVAEAGLEMNEKVVQSDASQGFEEMKAKKWPLICWFGLLLIERALSALNTSMH